MVAHATPAAHPTRSQAEKDSNFGNLLTVRDRHFSAYPSATAEVARRAGTASARRSGERRRQCSCGRFAP